MANSVTRSLGSRKFLAWSHLWLGLIGGAFLCLMGVTGTIVTFRPQIAMFLAPSPVPVAACHTPIDWNEAQRQIEGSVNSRINRIYFPDGSDPRFHIRMMTPTDAIYTHVIYDGCAGQVLGTVNLEWMDWLVDLHHNLLADNTGRNVAGAIGIVLFLSAGGGLLLWLFSKPSLKRVFRLQTDAPLRKTALDLHRAIGLVATVLLLVAAFTGTWLCYPNALRSMIGLVASAPADARPERLRAAPGAPLVGLQELISAAEHSIPDGRIREIRMPDGYGNVQIRMWRAGDFRSLGNNVVTVDRATAKVLGENFYSDKTEANRFIQAMAGLHYAEWGGLPYRTLYGVTGLATAPLFLTGFVFWWLRRRRNVAEPLPSSMGPGPQRSPASGRI